MVVTRPTRPPRLVGHRRRAFQWCTAVIMLAVPFLRWGGQSLLRVDLAQRSLLAFGHTLRLEEFPLVLPLVLASLTTLLLLTLVFGRVWCGWACPQTLWADLVEAAARRVGARVKGGALTASPAQLALFHLASAVLGLVVGANLVWYFLAPYEYVPRALAGELPIPAVVATLSVALIIYLDLAFLRRTFCSELCPYGRFQAALVDRGTLTLQLLPEEAERCIECEACVRACPTGVDIRQGADVACINCGRCLDACCQVMAKRGENGLIGYTWGTTGRSARALLTPRTGVVFLLALVAWSGLAVATVQREPLAFSVRRSSTAEPRTVSGERFATFLSGTVTNRTGRPLDLKLVAEAGGQLLEVRGPGSRISLAAGQRSPVEFAVVAPLRADVGPIAATLSWMVDGVPVASRGATLLPPSGEGKRKTGNDSP